MRCSSYIYNNNIIIYNILPSEQRAMKSPFNKVLLAVGSIQQWCYELMIPTSIKPESQTAPLRLLQFYYDSLA